MNPITRPSALRSRPRARAAAVTAASAVLLCLSAAPALAVDLTPGAPPTQDAPENSTSPTLEASHTDASPTQGAPTDATPQASETSDVAPTPGTSPTQDAPENPTGPTSWFGQALEGLTDRLPTTTQTYGRLGYPYAGTVWTTRVDQLGDGAVDPNSKAMTDYLARQVASAPSAKTWWVNSDQYNGRVYLADEHTPRVKLGFGADCGGRSQPADWDSWAGDVPLDPSWGGSNGTDQSIVVIDQARRHAYSLWVYKGGSTPTACHGGMMTLGATTPEENSGETPGVYPHMGGASASSLPHDAGSVSKDDVAYAQAHGYFPHALYVGLPDTREGMWSCPATRTDGSDENLDSIMEGQRLRLVMRDQEISALPSQWQQWVARTGVRYGFIVGDKTADTAIIATVDDDTYWPAFAATQPGGLSIADVPFADHLQALKPNAACTGAPAAHAQGGNY